MGAKERCQPQKAPIFRARHKETEEERELDAVPRGREWEVGRDGTLGTLGLELVAICGERERGVGRGGLLGTLGLARVAVLLPELAAAAPLVLAGRSR